MSWYEALMLILTFCTSGSYLKEPLHKQNECRKQKLECVKRVTHSDRQLQNPVLKAEREVYLVNGCLDDHSFKPVPLPPEPQPQGGASPAPAKKP